jgi:hypothetical protein
MRGRGCLVLAPPSMAIPRMGLVFLTVIRRFPCWSGTTSAPCTATTPRHFTISISPHAFNHNLDYKYEIIGFYDSESLDSCFRVMTSCSHVDTNVSQKFVASIFRVEVSQPGTTHSDCINLALELRSVEMIRICDNLKRVDTWSLDVFIESRTYSTPLFQKFENTQGTAPNSKINLQHRVVIWLILTRRYCTQKREK